MSEKQKIHSILEIMNGVLGRVRNYYDSEYVYYIEKDEYEILTIYEWCAENVQWQRDRIKLLDSEQWPKWVKQEILDTTEEELQCTSSAGGWCYSGARSSAGASRRMYNGDASGDDSDDLADDRSAKDAEAAGVFKLS